MATPEEINWLYRCILGREATPDTYDIHGASSFNDLRKSLISSEEATITRLKASVAQVPVYRAAAAPSYQLSLALACIVKDGAATIERMLRSCYPIVNFVAIYDTGSSDGTLTLCRSICEEIGIVNRIDEGTFSDFAQARNCALALLPSDIDWVLMLDADEYLIPEDLHLVLDLMRHGEIDAWQIPRYNFVDKAQVEPVRYYPDFQRRLLRNLPHIRYAGSVYEHVVGTSRWGYAPLDHAAVGGNRGGPHIHHTALADMTIEVEERKNKLYAGLA